MTTANIETINSIATAIVSALIDRLVSDDAFINGVAERVGHIVAVSYLEEDMTKAINSRFDNFMPELDTLIENKTNSSLAEFIDSRDLMVKIEEIASEREISTDDINDFESAVEREVESKLDGFEIDADNVSGLDDAIESKFNDLEVEASTVTGFDKGVTDVLDDVLEDKIRMALAGNVTSTVRSLLGEDDVRNAIVGSVVDSIAIVAK